MELDFQAVEFTFKGNTIQVNVAKNPVIRNGLITFFYITTNQFFKMFFPHPLYVIGAFHPESDWNYDIGDKSFRGNQTIEQFQLYKALTTAIRKHFYPNFC
jgi:hypothetical protein